MKTPWIRALLIAANVACLIPHVSGWCVPVAWFGAIAWGLTALSELHDAWAA